MKNIGATPEDSEGEIVETDAHAFVVRETMLLDQRRLEEWLELFTDELLYWIPCNRWDLDPSVEISIAYDDRGHLAERVERALSEHSWAQRPTSRTLHIVGEVCAADDDGSQRSTGELFASRQLIVEQRVGRLSLYPALCEYALVQDPQGEIKMCRKKIMLLNADEPLGNLTFLL